MALSVMSKLSLNPTLATSPDDGTSDCCARLTPARRADAFVITLSIGSADARLYFREIRWLAKK